MLCWVFVVRKHGHRIVSTIRLVRFGRSNVNIRHHHRWIVVECIAQQLSRKRTRKSSLEQWIVCTIKRQPKLVSIKVNVLWNILMIKNNFCIVVVINIFVISILICKFSSSFEWNWFHFRFRSDPEPVSMTSNDLHEKSNELNGKWWKRKRELFGLCLDVCQGRVCHRTFWLILVVFGLILSVLFLLISFICRKYFIGNLKKCRKSSRSPATHTNGSVANPSETSPFLIENQFELNSNSIEVGNLFKRGRFSQLDKGLYKNQQVALKTFANEPQSTTLFDNEKFIYSLISIQHKNILK